MYAYERKKGAEGRFRMACTDFNRVLFYRATVCAVHRSQRRRFFGRWATAGGFVTGYKRRSLCYRLTILL